MRKWATDLTDSTDQHGLLLERIRANPPNPFDPWSIPKRLLDNALARVEWIFAAYRLEPHSQKLMVYGEARGGGARGDLQLAVDRAQMRVDGVRAEN